MLSPVLYGDAPARRRRGGLSAHGAVYDRDQPGADVLLEPGLGIMRGHSEAEDFTKHYIERFEWPPL